MTVRSICWALFAPFAIAAVLLLGLPSTALAQGCPPNAHVYKTERRGGDIVHRCKCNEGYIKSHGRCVRPWQALIREQEEFKLRHAEWLHKVHDRVREAVEKSKEWTTEVMASIREGYVPNPLHRPKSLDDLQPGDIFLVAPATGKEGRVSRIITVADQFATLRVFKTGKLKSHVSHAGAVVKNVKGNILFLDHTGEGSRILSEKDFIRNYGHRRMYVARPQAVVNGRKLWGVARGAAMRDKSGYGLAGDDKAVCSEEAAIAVIKATGLPFHQKRLGPVDITPEDFFDKKHIGKYFILSPIGEKSGS